MLRAAMVGAPDAEDQQVADHRELADVRRERERRGYRRRGVGQQLGDLGADDVADATDDQHPTEQGRHRAPRDDDEAQSDEPQADEEAADARGRAVALVEQLDGRRLGASTAGST